MRPDFQPPRLIDPGLRRRLPGPRPWLWFVAGAACMLAGLAMMGRVG